MNVDLSKQADLWRFLAGEMRHWNAAFCAQLCDAIAEDEDLQCIAMNTRPGQPPTQFLAAAQYLLIRGAQHELRQHFPSLNGGTKASGDPIPLFKDFCNLHRNEIIQIIRTHATNTNEIARSAGLNAGFRTLASQSKEPLHLIEIGPSAGFNLLWDRYEIDYVKEGVSHKAKARNPLLTVEVELRGNVPPLNSPPEVASRLGLELNPVDLDNQDERDWLRAVVHPDHIARHERIKKILALRREERAEIRGGDAIALLPKVLSELPAGGTVCVYHTFAVYQFSDEMKEELEKIFTEASESRAIWRLSNEWGPNGKCPLTLSKYERGTVTHQTLAYCDMHGKWIEWL